MYNRYVRRGDGAYQRIPADAGAPAFSGGQPRRRQESALSLDGLLSRLLGRLKLEDMDTGDLLLLAILFLLFREGEDEELLIALGLLLIL